MRSRTPRTMLAAALVTAVVALPAQAKVTVQSVVDRPDAKHPSGHEFEISRKDCENAKDLFTFDVKLADFGSKQLEVWLAEDSTLDCKLKEDRTQSQASHCVLVTTKAPDDTLKVAISSAEIAGKFDGVSGCIDSNSNTAARTFSLYFLLIDANGADVDATDAGTWTSKLDMLGPGPPTDVTAGLGDGLLVVDYTAPSSSDVDGFTVYCDPPAGTTSATSGVTTTGAGGGGGGGSGSCSSSVLVPGKVPDSSLVSCGSAAKSSATANAKGLTNGTTYAVAVASHDVLDNVGALSELACGTPAPVDDFFQTYRDAGGTGGGGCSISGAGLVGQAGLFGLGLAGLALAARRARSTKR
ncbi:MAG: hypothetical protein U0414_14955 [Polyangiaceae bacterium]